jgi:hypothetical protein
MFGDSEENSIEEQFGEVWSTTRHIAHEDGPVYDLGSIKLTTPVDGEQLHPNLRVYPVEVKPTCGKIKWFQLS